MSALWGSSPGSGFVQVSDFDSFKNLVFDVVKSFKLDCVLGIRFVQILSYILQKFVSS